MDSNNNEQNNGQPHEQLSQEELKRKFAEEYNASSVGGERGLRGIRSSPSMYLSSSSIAGARQALIEIIQNGVDEGAAFLNFMHDNGVDISKEDFIRISIVIDKDDNVIVQDTGRGVPPDHHPKFGMPTMEVVFEEVNIGGKGKGFIDETKSAYKTFTIGKHGTGAACANATADYFHVTSKFMRDDKVFEVKWDEAIKTQPMQEVGPANGEHGTTVAFRPSRDVFKMYDDGGKLAERFYEFEWLKTILTEYAYNADGIIFNLDVQKEDGEWDSIMLDSSLLTPAQRLGVAEEDLFGASFVDDELGFKVDLYLNANGPFHQITSVNMLPIKQGTHIEAINLYFEDLERELIPLAQEQLKANGIDFYLTPQNLRSIGVPKLISYVNYYMSVSMADPDYTGQSKEKLSTPQILAPMSKGLHEEVGDKLDDLKVLMAERFFKSIFSLAANYVRMKSEEALMKDQEDIKEMKKQIKSKKKGSIKGLDDNSNEIARAREQDLGKVILYIVEGSTAFSALLSVRYAQNETVYALNRRPINVFNYTTKQLRKSTKFNSLYELFYGEKGKSDYGTIVLATDPDEDGGLINLYLLALIARYFPDYISQGKVVVFKAFKYAAIGRDLEPKLFRDDKECREFITANPAYSMTQFKGLGSIPNNLLRSVMDNTDNYDLIDPNTLQEGLAALEQALQSTSYKQRFVLNKYGSLQLNVHYIDRKRILKTHEIDYDVNDLDSGFTDVPDMSMTTPFRESYNLISDLDDVGIDQATSNVMESFQASLAELEKDDAKLDDLEQELFGGSPESDIDIESE